MSKINTRNKGHSLERSLAKLFRELGYTNCLTSRLESRRLDSLKVDLCHTGQWQVQSKAVEQSLNIHDILASMPQTKGKTNLVFHKRNRKSTIVAMRQEDFIEILQMLITNGIIKPC